MSKSLLFFVFELQQGCVTTSGQPYAHAQKSSQTVHHGLRNTSFKRQAIHPDIPPDHPTWQSHLSPVTSLTENLSSSRYSPRIISGTLQPENRSSRSIIFNQLSDRRDILPDHPTRQSHFLPVTSWPGNLLSSSRYGPRICRQRVTARIRPSSHYSPENLFVT